MNEPENLIDLCVGLGLEPEPNTRCSELIEQIYSVGRQDHVYAFTDDFMGLSSSIPNKIQNLTLFDLQERYEADDESIVDFVDTIKSAGNPVYKYNNKELTDEDRDWIQEDRQSRGCSDD
ncbi:hypothetical protein ACROAH_21455 [Shewanella oncorhynchi]|uniref:hypothetical protein n=1 Tax=Shewanella oncorhynchi TaxID=2726434 RepID=UPI003D79191B